jgi:transposase-like protein
MEKQRKKYAREFKLEAVRLLTGSDMTIAQASRDLGINPNLLARWKKEFQSDDLHGDNHRVVGLKDATQNSVLRSTLRPTARRLRKPNLDYVGQRRPCSDQQSAKCQDQDSLLHSISAPQPEAHQPVTQIKQDRPTPP